LKKKLDVDFHKYAILGACNPSFAHKALQAEPHMGTMLPCNVIFQELMERLKSLLWTPLLPCNRSRTKISRLSPKGFN